MSADRLGLVGRNYTDSDRQLDWLAHQVRPVLKSLEEWYPRDELVAWLFGDGDRPEVRLLNELLL